MRFKLKRSISPAKQGNERGYGMAEAPPVFQAGWSNCSYFFVLITSISFSQAAHVVLKMVLKITNKCYVFVTVKNPIALGSEWTMADLTRH
jgi:hypothetical protein